MKDFYKFLVKQVKDNREKEQSPEKMRKIEKLARYYLTAKGREKFYNEIYKA